jgi:hypothetical protein
MERRFWRWFLSLCLIVSIGKKLARIHVAEDYFPPPHPSRKVFAL